MTGCNPAESVAEMTKVHNPKTYSGSTNAQINQLLGMLKQQSITTLDARRAGIHHVAGRVQDARKRGHNIMTTMVHVLDDLGLRRRVACYSLVRTEQVVA